jgi:molybdopterin-guanine dinucleotide biosynthesis protein A
MGVPFSVDVALAIFVGVSAVILAGGESKRFGRPKALVEIAGRAMIAHVADALGPLADETIVSLADRRLEESFRSIVPRAVLAYDAQPGRGPIEGLRCASLAAQGGILLVAPCDAPLLRPQLYRLLLDALGDHDAAVPKLESIDPVRAVFRRRRVLEALTASPDTPSPSALVDRLDTVFVPRDRLQQADPDLVSFFDVNTPTDLERALKAKASTS